MQDMKPGKPLEIFVMREGYRYRLLSKVEDAEEGKVYISLIASGNRIFRFLPTDEIELIYKDGERMWKWSSITGSIAMLDDERVHCLESSKEGVSYNRRESFRVRLGAEHTYTKLLPKLKEPGKVTEEKDMTAEATPEDYDFVTVACVIKDLSETGVAIYTNDKMDIDTRIEMSLPTRQGILKVSGTVVRRDSGDYGKYREFYGCRLDKIDKNLSKYLFDLQRLQLKKERGEA